MRMYSRSAGRISFSQIRPDSASAGRVLKGAMAPAFLSRRIDVRSDLCDESLYRPKVLSKIRGDFQMQLGQQRRRWFLGGSVGLAAAVVAVLFTFGVPQSQGGCGGSGEADGEISAEDNEVWN